MTSPSYQTCLQTLWWKTTTQLKKNPHQFLSSSVLALAETQSGSSLTLPLLLSVPSLSKKKMMVVLTPSTQKIDEPPLASCHSVPVPFTTQYYWKWKLVKEKDGSYTRKFVRRYIQCRKFNKQRITSTHRRNYGYWYCQETDTKPFAEWKAELLKQSSGRKKFWRVGSPMHIRLHCSFNFNFISFELFLWFWCF